MKFDIRLFLFWKCLWGSPMYTGIFLLGMTDSKLHSFIFLQQTFSSEFIFLAEGGRGRKKEDLELFDLSQIPFIMHASYPEMNIKSGTRGSHTARKPGFGGVLNISHTFLYPPNSCQHSEIGPQRNLFTWRL